MCAGDAEKYMPGGHFFVSRVIIRPGPWSGWRLLLFGKDGPDRTTRTGSPGALEDPQLGYRVLDVALTVPMLILMARANSQEISDK
jgi:hypothetical protein